jgi:4-amino-4-deoxy-L-arabinose transferase-like glycosyltransferase
VYNGYGNSVWALTFRFNGINRVIGAMPQGRVRATGGYTDAPQPDVFAGASTPWRGPQRLLTGRMGTQIGWFLPVAAIGLLSRRSKLRPRYAARDPDDLFWAVWLAIGWILFSIAGDLKPQYLEAIAPAVAVEAALGLRWLCRPRRAGERLRALGILGVSLHAAFLLLTVGDETRIAALPVALAGGLAAAAVLRPLRPSFVGAAAPLLCGALFAGPVLWSIATAIQPQTGSGARYPTAGPAAIRDYPPALGGDAPGAGDPQAEDAVLRFLVAQNGDRRYLVLTERALDGNAARYILVANHPVLTLDSFDSEGQAAGRLESLVESGQLRFLELPAEGPWSDPRAKFGAWFTAHCGDITLPQLLPLGGAHLYDCR